MPGEAFVDVTYRGIELGTHLRLSQFGPQTAYLETPKPMPVGTRVAVTTETGLSFGGLVLHVNEQVAGAERQPGMRIAADALDGDAKVWWDAQVSAADASDDDDHDGSDGDPTAHGKKHKKRRKKRKTRG